MLNTCGMNSYNSGWSWGLDWLLYITHAVGLDNTVEIIINNHWFHEYDCTHQVNRWHLRTQWHSKKVRIRCGNKYKQSDNQTWNQREGERWTVNVLLKLFIHHSLQTNVGSLSLLSDCLFFFFFSNAAMFPDLSNYCGQYNIILSNGNENYENMICVAVNQS